VNIPKVDGIEVGFSRFERGIWFDSDHKKYQPHGFGVKLALVWGIMVRPIPKYWKLGYWRGEDLYNPWRGGEYVTVLKFPFVGPFLSICIGRLGLYLGFKTFEVYDPRHTGPDRYGLWLDKYKVVAGTKDNPAQYIQLSGSIRRTRWK
jgi:hypothetical protein